MINRFNRYELKYIVTARMADALTADIDVRMTPDPKGGESGRYQVTSMYYDTRELDCYRAKLDGIKYRRKLRIRRYGPLGLPPVSPVMVEIKQRMNRTIQKRRIVLDLAQALALCEGEFEVALDDPFGAMVAGEIEFLVRALALRPTCTVSYIREAFVGSIYEPGLRVTLDRNLWCREPAFGLTDGGRRYAFIPQDRVILEVKANDAVPLWVARMLARHGCTIGRFSKYCAGLEHLRGLSPANLLRIEEE